MKFVQIDNWGKVVGRFNLEDLLGDFREKASKLQIEEEIQFTGQTVLKRITYKE